MRTRREVTTWAEAPFGGGSLRVEKIIRRELCYDGLVEVMDVALVYLRKRRKRLNGLAEIPRIASKEAIDLPHAVADQPLHFAEIVSEYEGIGRVVYPSPRFHYLTEIFINPIIEEPWVKERKLRFHAITFGLDQPYPPPFWEVVWDLATGE